MLVPHEMRDHPEAMPLLRLGASVQLQNVTFRYPGADTVFEDLNLRIEPGQRVGLVGQSGGGKSTLFALLQRFYDLQSGGIFVDGQDITRWPEQQRARLMSRVFQSPFAGTASELSVAENLALAAKRGLQRARHVRHIASPALLAHAPRRGRLAQLGRHDGGEHAHSGRAQVGERGVAPSDAEAPISEGYVGKCAP